MQGQAAGDGAFTRARGTIDGDNDLSAQLRRSYAASFRAHPRFFVLCLEEAVKPYRVLLPTLVAADNAGLRLPRAARTSGRGSFLERLGLERLAREVLARLDGGFAAAFPAVAWPLRRLLAALGFVFRKLGAPFT
jgi:hypothetical protein